MATVRHLASVGEGALHLLSQKAVVQQGLVGQTVDFMMFHDPSPQGLRLQELDAVLFDNIYEALLLLAAREMTSDGAQGRIQEFVQPELDQSRENPAKRLILLAVPSLPFKLRDAFIQIDHWADEQWERRRPLPSRNDLPPDDELPDSLLWEHLVNISSELIN